MLRSIKSPLIVVIFLVICLFTGAAMLIQFEQQSEVLTAEIIDTINQQSAYQLRTKSTPTISIFPWLGIQTEGVTLSHPSLTTPISAKQVSVKFNPFAWITGAARISAIRLSGLNVQADSIPPLLQAAENITFPHIHNSDTIDLEIQQATIEPPADQPWIQSPITQLHARLIGFNPHKPYTVNASGEVSLLGQSNIVQIKTLAQVDNESASLHNTHLKVLRNTPHGHLRLIADSNIDYTYASKQLHLHDLIGFINNAEFIGKLDLDLAKEQTEGNLHFLMFSLKNFAHAMDKSIKISDKSGAYNTKAEMHFHPGIVEITADIDKQPLEATIDMQRPQQPAALHVKTFKLTTEDVDLFSAIHSSKIIPPFGSYITVDELLWNTLKLKQGTISITQHPHATEITTKFDDFYRGTLTNVLHLYPDHATMQTLIKHGQVSPLLADLGVSPEPASGTIDLVSDSNSDGRTYSELLNHAHSRMLVKLHNGHLSSSVNPTTIIMQYLSASNIQTTRPTLYQDINAHCTMTSDDLQCNPIHIHTRNSKMQGYMDLARSTLSLQARMWLNTIKDTTTIPLSVNYRGTLQNIMTEIDVNNPQQSLATKTHRILQHYA
jgi:hypothetical protein